MYDVRSFFFVVHQHFQRLNLGSTSQSASPVRQMPFFSTNRGTDYHKDPSTPEERTSKGGRGMQNKTCHQQPQPAIGYESNYTGCGYSLLLFVILPVLNGEKLESWKYGLMVKYHQYSQCQVFK